MNFFSLSFGVVLPIFFKSKKQVTQPPQGNWAYTQNMGRGFDLMEARGIERRWLSSHSVPSNPHKARQIPLCTMITSPLVPRSVIPFQSVSKHVYITCIFDSIGFPNKSVTFYPVLLRPIKERSYMSYQPTNN